MCLDCLPIGQWTYSCGGMDGKSQESFRFSDFCSYFVALNVSYLLDSESLDTALSQVDGENQEGHTYRHPGMAAVKLPIRDILHAGTEQKV